MAAGHTTSESLAESLPTMVQSARIVREFEGVMVRLIERTDLSEHTGLAWNESSLAQLNASSVTELTENENFQQITDTLISIKPTFVQVVTLVTDKAKARISANVAAQIGVLGQNAMQRKKDQDLLTVVQAATTDTGSAGNPMTFGQIGAAVSRIGGNANEPSSDNINTVMHSTGIKDIQDQLESGIGTNPVPDGPTASVFRKGFRGEVSGSNVWHDGNITTDSLDDAIAATFAREAVILVDGLGPNAETERKPRIGGGADIVTLTDEYGIGQRSSGNWLYSHTHDAIQPTS